MLPGQLDVLQRALGAARLDHRAAPVDHDAQPAAVARIGGLDGGDFIGQAQETLDRHLAHHMGIAMLDHHPRALPVPLNQRGQGGAQRAHRRGGLGLVRGGVNFNRIHHRPAAGGIQGGDGVACLPHKGQGFFAPGCIVRRQAHLRIFSCGRHDARNAGEHKTPVRVDMAHKPGVIVRVQGAQKGMLQPLDVRQCAQSRVIARLQLGVPGGGIG